MTVIVPIHKPSSTLSAVYAYILSPHEKHLVLAKTDHIEIYEVTESGLSLVETAPLYGHITALYAFRPPNCTTDILALTTEERTVIVLNFDQGARCFNCIASIRISPYDARIDAVDTTPMMVFDEPSFTLLVHAYHGKISLVKFAPEVFTLLNNANGNGEGGANSLGSTRISHEAIRGKIDITNEMFTFANIDSICIIPQNVTVPNVKGTHRPSSSTYSKSPSVLPAPAPALAILFRDNMFNKHVGISIAGTPHHDVYLRPTLRNVDPGAEHILTIPEPIGGFLILGETKLEYVKVKNVSKVRDATTSTESRRKRNLSQNTGERGGRRKLTEDNHLGASSRNTQNAEENDSSDEFQVTTQEFPLVDPTIFACFTIIDARRILLSSESGQLSLVMIIPIQSDNTRISLTHQILGSIPAPTSLVHIAHNVFFATSHYASSVLFTLGDGSIDSSIEIIQEFPNLAPLSDFEILPYDNNGIGNCWSTPSIVACTGGYNSGAVRKVEFGTNFDILAQLDDLLDVDNIWTLQHGRGVVVLTQVNKLGSRVFEYTPEGSLAELNTYMTLDLSEKSQFVGYLSNGTLVQVTSSFVQSSDGTRWDAFQKTINAVSVDGNYICLTYDANNIAVFRDTLAEPLHSKTHQDLLKGVVNFEICDVAISYDVAQNRGLGAFVTWKENQVHFFGTSFSRDELLRRKEEPCTMSYFPDLVIQLKETPRSIQIIPHKNTYQIIIGYLNGSISYCTLTLECHGGYELSQLLGPFKLGIEPVTFSQVNSKVYAISDNLHELSLMDGRADQANAEAPIRDVFPSLLNLKDVSCLAELSLDPNEAPLGLAGNALGLILFKSNSEDSSFHTMDLQVEERVRRITRLPALDLLALITVEKRLSVDGLETLHSFVKIVNQHTFEILDSYALAENEIGESLLNLSFKEFETVQRMRKFYKESAAIGQGIGLQVKESQQIKDSAINDRDILNDILLVGTGVDKGTDDVTMGNLKVLQISDLGKIKELSNMTVQGAVYAIKQIGGDSFAFSVNSLVQTAEIPDDTTYQINLTTNKKDAFVSPTVALSLDATETLLLVGDMMQGTRYLTRNTSSDNFKPLQSFASGRNNSTWVTAVAIFDDTEYYVGDADGNFYISAPDRTQTRSIMLSGMVNRIRTLYGQWQPPVHPVFPLGYDWRSDQRSGLFDRLATSIEPRAILSTTAGGLYLTLHLFDAAFNWVLFRLQLAVIKNTWALNTLGLPAESQLMIYREFCNESANTGDNEDQSRDSGVTEDNREFRRGTALDDDVLIDGAIVMRFLKLDGQAQRNIVEEVLIEIELHRSQTNIRLANHCWQSFYENVDNGRWNTESVTEMLTVLQKFWN